MLAAFCDTVTSSSSVSVPSSSISSSRRMVISLVTEATGRSSSAFNSKITWPLSASSQKKAGRLRLEGRLGLPGEPPGRDGARAGKGEAPGPNIDGYA